MYHLMKKLLLILMLLIASIVMHSCAIKSILFPEYKAILISPDSIYLESLENFIIEDSIEEPSLSENIDTTRIYYFQKKKLIDIINTRLDLNIDWKNNAIIGEAILTLKPHLFPQNEIKIDAKGFKINRVALEADSISTDLQYDYDNKVITIKLDFIVKEPIKILIDYIAYPDSLFAKNLIKNKYQGAYFINSDGSDKDIPKQIWTLNETSAASCWFPTIDSPDQKMTQDVFITVEKNQTAISNGELVYSTLNHKKDSTKTFYWRMSQPHSPYLTCIVVGDFQIKTEKYKNTDLVYYTSNDYNDSVKYIFGKTPETIQFMENLTGISYPWKRYSQVGVFGFESNGMENTGLSVYGSDIETNSIQRNDDNNEQTIVHETAHQWFGDLVTCKSWSQLALNEAFATYSELLWTEKNYSQSDCEALINDWIGETEAIISINNRPVITNYFTDPDIELFDAISYERGAMNLHTLRYYLGDSIFFKSIKQYVSDYKFSNVDIFDLKKSFETVSGEDLYWFFNQWFLSKTIPEINLSYIYNDSTKITEIELVQENVTDFNKLFVLPINILIASGNDVISKKETLTHKTTKFKYSFKEKPLFVCIDKYSLPLSKIEYPEMNTNKIALNKNINDLTRLNSLDFISNDSIKNLTFKQLLSDNNINLKLKVLGLLKNYKINDSIFIADFNPLLIKLLNESKNVDILVSAFSALSDYPFDKSIETISNSLIDSSYNVKFSYLEYLLKTNLELGIKKCETLEQSKDKNIKLILALLYSMYGSEKNEAFYKENLTTINHKKFNEMLSYYFDYVANKGDSIALNSIDFITELNKKTSSTYIKKSLKIFAQNLLANYSKKAEFSPQMEAIMRKCKEFNEL